MAHPTPPRGGSEKGQREHAGQTSEASDAGIQGKRQGIQGGQDTPVDDASDARDTARETGGKKAPTNPTR
jgi:hypothetical protein